MVQNIGKIKKTIKVGKISDKFDILRIREKLTAFIGNKTQRRLEMTLWKRELEFRWFKSVKMLTNKRIKKEKYLLSNIGGKICWSFLQVKHQKVVKIKIKTEKN